MEIFGITVARTKALVLNAVRNVSSMWATIREPFTGAWQRNIECETPRNILAFATVFSCVSLISNDFAKIRVKLTELGDDGIWREVKVAAFSPVLRKPNRYQTRIQFFKQWMVSKLLWGNAYILKERDQRGVVTELFVLDPKLVTVLVADDGSVYYQLKKDALSGLGSDEITLPASEIIHDRMLCLWHPLIGVSPIYACAASATQGIRIQNNSAKFFENMSRPSIHLSAPGKIDTDTARRIKETVEQATSGSNLGRVLVTGDGLKMDVMTIPAADAQLIEQYKLTREDVLMSFHVPPHKAGISDPSLNNVAALNQDYYNQCMQIQYEEAEACLNEGLGLDKVDGHTYSTEFDIDGLLRMDPVSRAERLEKLKNTMTPNEARLTENLEAVKGGNSVMRQQQEFSLEALAKRDAKGDPFATTAPAAATTPAANDPDATEAAAKSMRDAITAATAEGFESVRAETKAALDKMAADIPEAIAKAMPQPVIDESAALIARLREKFAEA